MKAKTIDGGIYMKQVYKPTARRLYLQGKTIYLLPCKVGLDSAWVKPYPISQSNGMSFEHAINEFTYYNCCPELGKYIHYYIEEEGVQ